jgi:hypothetical protein
MDLSTVIYNILEFVMRKSIKCIMKYTFCLMISSMMLSAPLLATPNNNNENTNQLAEEQTAAQVEKMDYGMEYPLK